MESLSIQDQRVVAELNRRVLAGRPTPAAMLTRLELLYQHVSDVWGPPGTRPSPADSFMPNDTKSPFAVPPPSLPAKLR